MTANHLKTLLTEKFKKEAVFSIITNDRLEPDEIIERTWLRIDYKIPNRSWDEYAIIFKEPFKRPYQVKYVHNNYTDGYMNSYLSIELRPIDIINYIETLLKLESL